MTAPTPSAHKEKTPAYFLSVRCAKYSAPTFSYSTPPVPASCSMMTPPHLRSIKSDTHDLRPTDKTRKSNAGWAVSQTTVSGVAFAALHVAESTDSRKP